MGEFCREEWNVIKYLPVHFNVRWDQHWEYTMLCEEQMKSVFKCWCSALED